MNLLDYMKLCYNEALREGKKYGYLDGYEFYFVDDKIILHKIYFIEKFKEVLELPSIFYDADEGAFDEYRETLLYVYLGSLVSIKDYLFCGFRNLRRIEGRRVESVGRHAFVGTNLHGLHLPSLKSFYSNSFLYLYKDNYFYIDTLNLSHLNIGRFSANLDDVNLILYNIYHEYFLGEIDFNSVFKYKLYNFEERCMYVI